MFRFEHPAYLYALAFLPLLSVAFFLYWRWRKRAIERFGQTSLVLRLMPEASRWKHSLKFGLLLLALSFLVVGWANPQWGIKREKAQRKSTDVFIALDISNSMLAEDVPPNRLERAKKFAEDLVEKLKGNRIGVILFAGGAYLQMPLTTDYAAAEIFLRSASTDLAGTQGTAIGEAVQLAHRSFQQDDKKAHKALILLTDGEDHEGDATEIVKKARENGILLFTVAVGTPAGGFIPVNYGNRQDYKRDNAGKPIRTKVNEPMLKALAQAGGGEHFNIERSEQVITALRERIDKMEKQELEARSFSDYESHFQVFVLIALALLVLEFLISFKKEKWLEGRDIFK